MKKTTQLLHRIKNASKNDLSFLEDKDFKDVSLPYYLCDLLAAHHMSKIQYILDMNLDRTYGYQILNGRRRPTRELLIETAMLLQLDLEQTQRLLKIAQRNVLYPRVKTDAVAIFALEKKLNLEEYRELMDDIKRGI